jgi:hypothetical protein
MASLRGGSLRKLAMVAILCVAGPAAAAMPGLYFAGFYMDSTLAYSKVDAEVSGFDGAAQDAWAEAGGDLVTDNSEISDQTDIGYAFSVGYQLTDYFAAEITYLDMGTVKYEGVGIVSDDTNSYQGNTLISAKSKGLLLAAIGVWPMGDRWALDARTGILLGKTRVRSALYLNQQFIGTVSEADNTNSLMLGAGINWSMSPGTAIRIGYTRLGKAMIDDYTISSYTLSLKYAW